MLPLILSILSIVAFAPGQQAPPPSALHIVVLAGEDAVNVIQQKSAVAPLVEIRDRNNLPVAGATVTFTISGNSAAFTGGAQTLTVVTNAAGQAAAAGLSPVASGAVQINVAAAFQGQTIAATIAQTNVMTAAEAAGAAASGASGSSASGAASGAAGGGGGMSATTIGIVGAAVAGGAVAATQLAGQEDTRRELAGTFTMEMSLNFGGCVRFERHSGTLAMEFESLDVEPLRGTATIEGGRIDILPGSNCPNGPQPGQVQTFGMSPTPVTATGGSVSFSQSMSGLASDGSGAIVSSSLTFQGNRNADTITGTLTRSARQDRQGVIVDGNASAPVTLTPH